VIVRATIAFDSAIRDIVSESGKNHSCPCNDKCRNVTISLTHSG